MKTSAAAAAEALACDVVLIPVQLGVASCYRGNTLSAGLKRGAVLSHK